MTDIQKLLDNMLGIKTKEKNINYIYILDKYYKKLYSQGNQNIYWFELPNNKQILLVNNIPNRLSRYLWRSSLNEFDKKTKKVKSYLYLRINSSVFIPDLWCYDNILLKNRCNVGNYTIINLIKIDDENNYKNFLKNTIIKNRFNSIDNNRLLKFNKLKNILGYKPSKLQVKYINIIQSYFDDDVNYDNI